MYVFNTLKDDHCRKEIKNKGFFCFLVIPDVPGFNTIYNFMVFVEISKLRCSPMKCLFFIAIGVVGTPTFHFMLGTFKLTSAK